MCCMDNISRSKSTFRGEQCGIWDRVLSPQETGLRLENNFDCQGKVMYDKHNLMGSGSFSKCVYSPIIVSIHTLLI